MYSARVQRRAFGSAPSGAVAAPSNGLHIGTLVPIVSELDRMAPSFDLRGEDIRVIRTPAEFYETLKVRYCCTAVHMELDAADGC